MEKATGTFQVELTPESSKESEGTTLARMSLSKRFVGDLEGTGEGEMLSAMTSVEGSAAYVAIEQVTGVLHGRRGSFALQHQGRMDRGEQHLEITIVPDSGTDQLRGISGTMAIEIEDGTHSYALDYSLPD